MPRVRGDVGFDRLRKRQRDLGALLRGPQKHFIVGIADVAGFEQHGRRLGAAKDVESRETVRVGAKLEPSGCLDDEPRGEIG